MKCRVSDYIADFYSKNGIDTLFTITGGFSMHLNDSFGIYDKYNIYYHHHEQGCGYAATGYTKINNQPSIVCTTAGCAATNAITPCLVAHQDSLPVLFISGQVKTTETIRAMNTDKMKLRHYSGADSDIISMVTPITKYAKEITSVDEIYDVLVESMKQLLNGRPGPVWLSIPVDLQGMVVELPEVSVVQREIVIDNHSDESMEKIHELLKGAKRPYIIAGNGIKLGNCKDKFTAFLDTYKIPVGVTLFGTELIESEHPLYAGKVGLIGDRSGNFAMQNCDLLISLGCRMSQGIVGYRSDWFARGAKIVYIDNDPNELEKTNVNYAMKVNMDLNVFFEKYKFEPVCYDEWVAKCGHWKNKWSFEMPENVMDDSHGVNPYYALKHFYDNAPENKITLASSGSIITNVWHMVNIKKGDKFLISSQGDMGFELPAAIGAQIAEPAKMVVPILGEGSFQLNIQELQTIMQYKLPVKILLFNNASYGAISITQEKFFGNKFGTDVSSGISFPDSEKVANTYGLHYMCIRKNEDVVGKIQEFLDYDGGPVILEVFCCIQGRSPRLAARKNEDGTFSNRPLEDLEPFLERKEFEEEMIVDIV
jgi:acetolactate synthase-1/2/3 large subunit